MLTARPVRSGLAAAVIVLAATGVHAQPYDHLKCYKIKDTQTFTSASALTDVDVFVTKRQP